MPNPNLKSLLHKEMTRKEFLAFGALAAISVFGFIGVISELLSHAATPYATEEAQSGTRGGTTALATTTGSASNQVVEFGTGTVTTSTGLFVGISLGYDPPLFDLSDSGLAQYKIMKSSGFTSARLDCGYQTGAFSIDSNTSAALAAGLDVLLILDGYDASSVSAAQFASFCTNVVNTCKPLGIHRYEILNEANGNNNWNSNGDVNPAGYAALLKASYTAIKAVDPTATVIFSGLPVFSSSDGASQGNGNYASYLLPGTFVTLAYAAMGGNSTGYFDAMGAHPYAGGVPTTGNNWGVLMNPPGTAGYYGDSVRTIMVNNGDSAKKIWITEFGIGSDSDSEDASYTTQANGYTTTFDLINSYDYVGAFYIFNWNDDTDDDTNSNPPQYWGMCNSSFVAKPALATVSANIKTINPNA
jgi:hypothetical protein